MSKISMGQLRKIIFEEIELLNEDEDDVKALPKESDASKYNSDSLDSAIDAHILKSMDNGADDIADAIATSVHNFDKLFDFEGIIIRRALNKVSETDKELAADVLQCLKELYGLDVNGAIDSDDEFDKSVAPLGGTSSSSAGSA